MKTPFLNRRRGVTLTEVVIAASILALLIVLFLPIVRGQIALAQGTKCMTGMRKLGVALWLYRGDHNGWFPPGEPKHPSKDFNLDTILVPSYIDSLPICPGARKTLTPAEKRRYSNIEGYFRSQGGTYGINDVLTQWRVEQMPWPATNWIGALADGYSSARMPFLLETRTGSASWHMSHQNAALNGFTNDPLGGRHHGKGDSLNFMFLDGSMRRISRNDTRDVPEGEKLWLYPQNPNGAFQNFARGEHFIGPSQIGNNRFKELYPHLVTD